MTHRSGSLRRSIAYKPSMGGSTTAGLRGSISLIRAQVKRDCCSCEGWAVRSIGPLVHPKVNTRYATTGSVCVPDPLFLLNADARVQPVGLEARDIPGRVSPVEFGEVRQHKRVRPSLVGGGDERRDGNSGGRCGRGSRPRAHRGRRRRRRNRGRAGRRGGASRQPAADQRKEAHSPETPSPHLHDGNCQ